MLERCAKTYIEKIRDYDIPIDCEVVYSIVDSIKSEVDEAIYIDCIVNSSKFIITPMSKCTRILVHVGSSKNLSLEEIRYASEIIDEVFEKIEETLDITKGKDDDG